MAHIKVVQMVLLMIKTRIITLVQRVKSYLLKRYLLKKRITPKRRNIADQNSCTIDCPIRTACLGKSAQEKKFTVAYYREEYERNIARVESNQGRYMKGKRQSTAEPVFGTLTQFMGLNKVNAIGIKQANKCMQLSAIAYNLKKYMKFIEKRTKSGAGVLALCSSLENIFYKAIKSLLRPFKTPEFFKCIKLETASEDGF